MNIYWAFYLLPAMISVFEARQCASRIINSGHWKKGWLTLLIVMSVLIGQRHEVGGDWVPYLNMLGSVKGGNIHSILSLGEPAYASINLLASAWGGIYLVNSVCAAIFMFGLISFCLRTPAPWLGYTIAVPYLVIVLGMGYVRQGVAIAILMYAWCLFLDKRFIAMIASLFFAFLFHNTSAIFVLYALMIRGRLLGSAFTLIVILYVAPELIGHIFSRHINGYINMGMISSGAELRMLMNIVPAFIYIYFRDYMRESSNDDTLVYGLSWLAILMSLSLLLHPASTAIDRLALYIIPMQIYVWSRVPQMMISFGISKKISTVSVAAAYSVPLYVWLNYSKHAAKWLPYKINPWLIDGWGAILSMR